MLPKIFRNFRLTGRSLLASGVILNLVTAPAWAATPAKHYTGIFYRSGASFDMTDLNAMADAWGMDFTSGCYVGPAPGYPREILDSPRPAVLFVYIDCNGKISSGPYNIARIIFAGTPNTAVPEIPAPFDAAKALERMQLQTHNWITMQVLDPELSSRLDPYFQSAISAYRSNQPAIGNQQIEFMRTLIRNERPDTGRDEDHTNGNGQEKSEDKESALISRAAAQVLYHDLEYVLQRMSTPTHQRK